MALDDVAYAHITAHTSQVIDRFKDELRERLAEAPAQSEFWREQYRAYAFGAQAVWMSASAGLTNPADAATISQKVRSFTEAPDTPAAARLLAAGEVISHPAPGAKR